MKDMLFHTGVELTVVSDIMGQKLFLIQNDSLALGELKVLNTVQLVKYPRFDNFILVVGKRLFCEKSCEGKVHTEESNCVNFKEVTAEMAPLMFKNAFWVSLFLSHGDLMPVSCFAEVDPVEKDHGYLHHHAIMYLLFYIEFTC